eukprot:GHVS01064457.1.p1 GENE.GHVS01064457.1~~GHVS01064457.1.p1  ORF type:complete len:481 (-),score=28.44 GHVS01064457.1:95-1354(-)
MFAPHSLIPSLSGIVRQLAEGTPGYYPQLMPLWVARVMAATCYLLSSKVLADRSQMSPAMSASETPARSPHLWDMAIPEQLQSNSPFGEDDGASDEDDVNGARIAATPARDATGPGLLVAHEEPPDYGLLRQLANSILMRMRFHLSDARLQVRCYAYSSLLRGLCVLSTKKNDLLPNVHHMWPDLCAALSAELSLPAANLGCATVAYISYLCSDFIKSRFMGDVFPTIRNLAIRSGSPASASDSSRNGYVYRFQLTSLRTLALISQDAALIKLLSGQLAILSLRFIRPGVAVSLQHHATTLLRNAYISRCHCVSFIVKLTLEEASLLKRRQADECDRRHNIGSGSSNLQLLGYLADTTVEEIHDVCSAVDSCNVYSVLNRFWGTGGALPQIPVATGSKLFRFWAQSVRDARQSYASDHD